MIVQQLCDYISEEGVQATTEGVQVTYVTICQYMLCYDLR